MNMSQELLIIGFSDNADEQDPQIYTPPVGYKDWQEFSMDPDQADTKLLGDFDGADSEDLRTAVSKLEPSAPTEQVLRLLGVKNV